jgi:hypothetical protein
VYSSTYKKKVQYKNGIVTVQTLTHVSDYVLRLAVKHHIDTRRANNVEPPGSTVLVHTGTLVIDGTMTLRLLTSVVLIGHIRHQTSDEVEGTQYPLHANLS